MEQARIAQVQEKAQIENRDSVKELLKTSDVELCVGSQLAIQMLNAHGELAHRVGKVRRRFAAQYGFVIPEIKLTDDLSIGPKSYRIKIYGTVVAHHELRIGESSCCLTAIGSPMFRATRRSNPLSA